MHKFQKWISLSVTLFTVSLVMVSNSALAAKTTVVQGDFHLTLYLDQQGQIDDLELFTKIADKAVYLGLTCSHRSPFPMLELLLFNNEVLVDSPALLKVAYQINGPINPQIGASTVVLQGVLKAVDSADERSNKIRLELAHGQVTTMDMMQAAYQTLLEQLKAGDSVEITLKHQKFGEKQYHFSLQGLNALLAPNEAICR